MEEEELDEQVKKLQIGKCFCHSGNQNHSSKLFSGDDPIQTIGLVNGDYVFVKMIQPVVEDKDEEMQELDDCEYPSDKGVREILVRSSKSYISFENVGLDIST